MFSQFNVRNSVYILEDVTSKYYLQLNSSTANVSFMISWIPLTCKVFKDSIKDKKGKFVPVSN